MYSCYNCKHGETSLKDEPCKSCLKKDTPAFYKFEPDRPEHQPEHQQLKPITQLSIFDMIPGHKTERGQT